MALPLTYNLRNLRERWKTSLLAVCGVALVVAVVVVLLSMASGFRVAMRATGRPDNGLVVQRGSLSELTSWMSRDNANHIMTDSRVARGSDGQPLASCEVVVINAMTRHDGQPTNITLRAVTPRAFDVRGGIRLVQGRNFRQGLHEFIVGQRLLDRVQGAAIGSKIKFQNTQWDVVGVFAADGGSFESEVWADYTALEPLARRGGGCESLALRLTDPRTLAAFDKDLRANPQMQVQLEGERKYYEDQAGPVALTLTALAGFVGIVMGIGAVFGAMNTMYAIVAARTREVGTLRALGFSRRSILLSFVIESVFLALLGGALGCVLAFPMNGFSTGTGQTLSFSEIAFAFKITSRDLTFGLLFALLMGLFGGLLPALRAARIPITAALRSD